MEKIKKSLDKNDKNLNLDSILKEIENEPDFNKTS